MGIKEENENMKFNTSCEYVGMTETNESFI